MHRLVGKAATFEIPRIGGDDASRTDDPNHLLHPKQRVGHEMHDERGDSNVDGIVCKIDLHRIAAPERRNGP